MALHRAGDVAENDDLAGSLGRPSPDPLRELAAGRDVPAEHRPRGEEPAVMVELVATGPSKLEARLEEIDEPLRITQLGRGRPVEVAVPQELAGGVGRGGGDDPVELAAIVDVRGDRHRDAVNRRRVV